MRIMIYPAEFHGWLTKWARWKVCQGATYQRSEVDILGTLAAKTCDGGLRWKGVWDCDGDWVLVRLENMWLMLLAGDDEKLSRWRRLILARNG